MTAIPQVESLTVKAIYDAYAASVKVYDSLGISVGIAGTECDRALWYTFRLASNQRVPEGRNVSIFRTGDMWETRLVQDLEAIGAEVWGSQDRIRLLSGHVRGKRDGAALGIPEAPKTEHLCEFKSSKDDDFRKIKKDKCAKAKPLHYAQCQLGMHAFGLDRALYLVVNKDTDERYAERIKYDAEYTLRMIARLERIINLQSPPSRISENPEFFGCMFCDHKDTCHGSEWARVTCRSCLHSTPEMGGDGHWSCARFHKPLSFDEQKQACPSHLYIPDLVHGRQIDVDEENETITYEMKDGTAYVDGATNA